MYSNYSIYKRFENISLLSSDSLATQMVCPVLKDCWVKTMQPVFSWGQSDWIYNKVRPHWPLLFNPVFFSFWTYSTDTHWPVFNPLSQPYEVTHNKSPNQFQSYMAIINLYLSAGPQQSSVTVLQMGNDEYIWLFNIPYCTETLLFFVSCVANQINNTLKKLLVSNPILFHRIPLNLKSIFVQGCSILCWTLFE